MTAGASGRPTTSEQGHGRRQRARPDPTRGAAGGGRPHRALARRRLAPAGDAAAAGSGGGQRMAPPAARAHIGHACVGGEHTGQEWLDAHAIRPTGRCQSPGDHGQLYGRLCGRLCELYVAPGAAAGHTRDWAHEVPPDPRRPRPGLGGGPRCPRRLPAHVAGRRPAPPAGGAGHGRIEQDVDGASGSRSAPARAPMVGRARRRVPGSPVEAARVRCTVCAITQKYRSAAVARPAGAPRHDAPPSAPSARAIGGRRGTPKSHDTKYQHHGAKC
jgi:hypothetical protein